MKFKFSWFCGSVILFTILFNFISFTNAENRKGYDNCNGTDPNNYTIPCNGTYINITDPLCNPNMDAKSISW